MPSVHSKGYARPDRVKKTDATIVFTPEFAAGLLAGIEEWKAQQKAKRAEEAQRVAPTTWASLTEATRRDFRTVAPGYLTKLLRFDYCPEHYVNLPLAKREAVTVYHKLPFKEQVETLTQEPVYVFQEVVPGPVTPMAEESPEAGDSHAPGEPSRAPDGNVPAPGEGERTKPKRLRKRYAADDRDPPTDHQVLGGCDDGDGEGYVPPGAGERSRSQAKAPRGQLLQPNMGACFVSAIEDDSRVARELNPKDENCPEAQGCQRWGAGLYSVNFGQKSVKPLKLLKFTGRTISPGTPAVLHLVTVRDNGVAIYAPTDPSRSPSLRWLSQAFLCGERSGEPMTFEVMLNRVQLLLTSPTTYLPGFGGAGIPETAKPVQVRRCLDRKNALGVTVDDGMATCSPGVMRDILRALGGEVGWELVNGGDGRTPCGRTLTRAIQLRMLAFLDSRGETTVSKGTLRATPEPPGDRTIRLPESVCKASRPGQSQGLPYGLDVLKCTRKELSRCGLGPDLVSTLYLRCMCMPTLQGRSRAVKLLRELIDEARQHTLSSVARQAFGLESDDTEANLGEVVIHEPLIPVCRDKQHPSLEESVKAWNSKRVPSNRIAFRALDPPVSGSEVPPRESPLEELTAQVEEEHPHACQKGTSRALHLGANRYNMRMRGLRSKARLDLPGWSRTCLTLSDTEGLLKKGECLLVSGGKVVTGPMVVWRCPNRLPWDVEIHTAVPLPEGLKVVVDNALVLSAEGWVNSKMAGGDLDGDLDQVHGNKLLRRLVLLTQKAVKKVQEEFESRQRVKLEPPGATCLKGWHSNGGGWARVQEFRLLATMAETAPVRGQCGAAADRAAALVEPEAAPAQSETLRAALGLSDLAHVSNDCPAKATHGGVRERLDALSDVAGVAPGDQTSTARWRDEMLVPEVDSRRLGGLVDKVLSPFVAKGSLTLGRVWVPEGRCVLGYDAGYAMGPLLMQSPERCAKTWERSCATSVLQELAALLRSRWAGQKLEEKSLSELRLLVKSLRSNTGPTTGEYSTFMRSLMY